MNAPAAGADPLVTITLTEAGAIFEGLTNVHRYDRPSPAEVASYVRNLLGPNPGGAGVHIIGAEEDVEKLDRALAGYDVVLTAERPAQRHPVVPPLRAEEETVVITRPSAPPSVREGVGRWIDGNGAWVLGAGVVAVTAVVAGAIWATVAPGGEDAAAPQAPADVAGSAPGSAVAPPVASSSVRAPSVVVVRQGLSVELPPGFRVEPDGQMWRATGADPNFRLQLAVDNLYELPAEEMAAQVLRDIEADPEVELVSNDGAAITYLETAPDGSEALWRTWADAGHQLFVGCHTRSAPTTVQQATCRMAMDSADYDPEAVDSVT